MLGGDHDIGHYGIKTLPNVSYMAKVTLKEDKHNKGRARSPLSDRS